MFAKYWRTISAHGFWIPWCRKRRSAKEHLRCLRSESSRIEKKKRFSMDGNRPTTHMLSKDNVAIVLPMPPGPYSNTVCGIFPVNGSGESNSSTLICLLCSTSCTYGSTYMSLRLLTVMFSLYLFSLRYVSIFSL